MDFKISFVIQARLAASCKDQIDRLHKHQVLLEKDLQAAKQELAKQQEAEALHQDNANDSEPTSPTDSERVSSVYSLLYRSDLLQTACCFTHTESKLSNNAQSLPEFLSIQS